MQSSIVISFTILNIKIMKKSKIIGEAALFLLLIAAVGAISALSVRAAEVTGTLSSDLGTTGGSIGGSVGGSGGSSVGGTIGGGIGAGGSIGGTVGGGGGGGGTTSGSSGGSGGGAVLGASTGGSNNGSSGAENPGEVLGASTGPSFPATGLGPVFDAGNIVGAILLFASLVMYGFYRKATNA
jgi:hypothetical protein